MTSRIPSFATSFIIHAVLAGVLAWLAVDQVTSKPEPQLIDLELLPEQPVEEPEETLPEPPAPEPPAPEPMQRPAAVPKDVEVAKVSEPKPFAPDLAETGNREAPDEVEAIAAPTTTLVFDMEQQVGGGGGDYVSTSIGGTMPVAPGSGRGPGGSGGGVRGTANNLGVGDVAVSRDWQVTTLPEPVNDHDFEPDYPPLAKREGREARVIVELAVDRDGKVAAAEVLRGPKGHGFRESAVAYVRKLRFEPALSGTRRVAARIEWSVYFYVRN